MNHSKIFLQTLCLLVLGCALGPVRNPPLASLPDKSSLIRDQLVIHSDFRLPEHHRLVDELVAQRGDLAEKLRLPTSSEPIYVYLFDTPKRYQAFIRDRYPEFPERRAFFVETDTRLAVYAHWGDRVAEDLRHEVTHGYLHAVVPNLPLWLDEGLAEYFEVARGRRGLNKPHVELLQQQRREHAWQPDLARLEQRQNVAELSQQDYAESWAWVHAYLETSPERLEVLRGYLNDLRTSGTAPPLSLVFRNSPGDVRPEALLRHLEELGQKTKAEGESK